MTYTLPPGPAAAARWRQMMGRAAGSVDLRFADEAGFGAAIDHAELADVLVTRVHSSGAEVARERRHLARDSMPCHVLLLPLEGELQLAQGRAHCVLRPGQFALLDLDAPYRRAHRAALRVLALRWPTHMLRHRVGELTPWLAQARPAAAGLPRVLADLAASLLDQQAHVPAAARAACASRLADLAALMLACDAAQLPVAESSVRQALHARCLQAAEALLADPGLDPARVAAACGISVRTLHAVCREAGQPLGAWIRERRLALCHERLRTQPAVAVKAIALSAGFRSVSHFCHAFKARYGVAPGDLRPAAPRLTDGRSGAGLAAPAHAGGPAAAT
jgi:AraC-like DNA-binding protein